MDDYHGLAITSRCYSHLVLEVVASRMALRRRRLFIDNLLQSSDCESFSSPLLISIIGILCTRDPLSPLPPPAPAPSVDNGWCCALLFRELFPACRTACRCCCLASRSTRSACLIYEHSIRFRISCASTVSMRAQEESSGSVRPITARTVFRSSGPAYRINSSVISRRLIKPIEFCYTVLCLARKEDRVLD